MSTNYRILLLEDDESLLDVLRDVLEEEGFEVDTCAGSDKAIRLAREKDYDLMVADIRVDGIDGLSALSHVQSYRPTVDALVISGYADAHQAERTSRLGLGAVLKKPFDLDLFLHKVNTLLRDRAKRLEIKRAFESLLETSYWSTQQVARFLDNSESRRYNFHRLVDICGLLCMEMNLLGSHLEKVRAAALAAAWRQSRKESLIPPPVSVPDEFDGWLSHLAEWWNGAGPKKLRGRQIPIESRIMVIALAYCLEGESLEDPEEKWPGRFDPHLLQVLAAHPEIVVETEQSEGETSESLLELAQTLLRVGDFHQAAEALQEVINRGAETRVGVSALLLLARLRQRTGQFEEAKAMAFRTPELATAFGPALAAHAYRESGRLLMDFAETTAAESAFLKALEYYQDMGLEAQAAECYLAANLHKSDLFQQDETHRSIERLLSPQHRIHLGSVVKPLLESLLNQAALEPATQRSLGRLFLAFPLAAHQTVEEGTEHQQANALNLLQVAGSQRFPKVAEVLRESAHPTIRQQTHALSSVNQSQAGIEPLHVNTLGGLVVEVGDSRIPDKAWKTSKVRYLFARLVAAYPNPVNEDLLIEEFWPGDVEKGRKSLYTATSSVRGALKKGGLQSGEFVVKTPTGLALASDFPLNYDLDFLIQSLEKAKTLDSKGQFKEATVEYRKASLLGENRYLPNCYNDFASQLRDSVERRVLGACVRLTQLTFVGERYHETVEFAKRALQIDPAEETASGLLLEALILIGRPAEALREYQTFVKALEEELGISDATSMEDVRRRAVASTR